MDFLYKLYQVMENNNIYIEGEVDPYSREVQRFRPKGRTNKGTPIFVFVHDGGASFGDWREPKTWITWWERSLRDLNQQEKQKRFDDIARVKEQKQRIRDAAIKKCYHFLHNPRFNDAYFESHEYVKRKKIIPYYARQVRNMIVIPIHDINMRLQSLQFIKPDGFKKFKKGASFKNGMLIMAENILTLDIILVCEGWATACTIYEAIGSPVVCAFNADNITAVALALKTKYPNNEIHICGDNDQWKPQNIGQEKSYSTAKVVGGKMFLPNFQKFDTSSKPTDWNDLMILGGIEEVENQLSEVGFYPR